MPKNITRLDQLPTYAESPFVEELKSQIGTRTVMMGSSSYDAGAGATILAKTEERDNAGFIKLFSDNIKKFFELTGSEMRVLSYLMSITAMKEDRVVIVNADAAETTGLTERTVHRSLITLTQRNMIARTSTPKLYWINPTIFFRGNRLVLVQDYRKNDLLNINSDNEQQQQPPPTLPPINNYTSEVMIPQSRNK